MPVVRKASFDDARKIAEINAAVWQTAYKNLLPAEVLNTRKADEKRIDDWQQRTDNGKYTILVYDDGEVSGYLWAGPARDDIGIVYEIYALYVKSDRQRQGIGRQPGSFALSPPRNAPAPCTKAKNLLYYSEFAPKGRKW